MIFDNLMQKKVASPSKTSRTHSKISKEDLAAEDNREYNKAIIDRQKEIKSFSKELIRFNLSIATLVSQKPKKTKEIEQALEIAKLISDDPSLKNSFQNDKGIPIEFILQQLEVPKKFLKKNKSYLIAITLLICGPYTEMRKYFLGGC
ncbi:hypothetical protein AAGG74_16000 [Bacillus mexicanus]|uniref:hypothetical protein n=1 Tax=Bacillus mexicanus TaxID=2834415 RepID=UPI003D23B0F8